MRGTPLWRRMACEDIPARRVWQQDPLGGSGSKIRSEGLAGGSGEQDPLGGSGSEIRSEGLSQCQGPNMLRHRCSRQPWPCVQSAAPQAHLVYARWRSVTASQRPPRPPPGQSPRPSKNAHWPTADFPAYWLGTLTTKRSRWHRYSRYQALCRAEGVDSRPRSQPPSITVSDTSFRAGNSVGLQRNPATARGTGQPRRRVDASRCIPFPVGCTMILTSTLSLNERGHHGGSKRLRVSTR